MGGREIEPAHGICDNCGVESDFIYYAGTMESWCQPCINEALDDEENDNSVLPVSVVTLHHNGNRAETIAPTLQDAWSVTDDLLGDVRWSIADIHSSEKTLTELDEYRFVCCCGEMLEVMLLHVECDFTASSCPGSHWHTSDEGPFPVAYNCRMAFIEHADKCATALEALAV